MHLRLIRNATLRLEIDGRRLLVDPMLDPAGIRPPVEETLDWEGIAVTRTPHATAPARPPRRWRP